MTQYQKNLYLNFLETLSIGVLILDADSNYIYFNPAYCELNNKPKEFFQNMSIKKLQSMGYLDRSVWEQVMEYRKPVSSIITITNLTWSRTYNTLTLGIPFFNEHKEIQYVFLLQETLNDLNHRLQKGSANKNIQFHGDNGTDLPTDIIAESPQMRNLLSMIKIVAKTDASVLISGTSGTGKEIIAQYVHNMSLRKNKPLIVLNCASLPESLIESELFGYEKGAFSGASSTGKKGLIEASDGGTLFLDEINSLPISLQAKLLRVLETRQVTRLGSIHAKDIDFRLICATNEDLQVLISEKRFRSDLFYRINVISVVIPPLKERREDIIPLALYFLKFYCDKYACIKILSPSVLEKMEQYNWPGNVRELRNTVERLVITSPSDKIEINDALFPDLTMTSDTSVCSASFLTPQTEEKLSVAEEIRFDKDFSYKQYMDYCEKRLLLSALEEFGSPSAVAHALKIDVSNVYRKFQKHHIKP